MMNNVNHKLMGALATCGLGLLLATTASAADPWAGQTFLSDYGKLQPLPGLESKDFAYFAPHVDKVAGKYVKVMVDQPEVFISPESPYKGAKPEDLAAITNTIRSTVTAALEQRGYTIVDKPGPDTLYARIAVTNVQIQKKKKGLLSYTPVGFVVSAGVKALQEFMDKYDLLDVALQTEVQDSMTHEVLAASVIQRGKSGDAKKAIGFDALVAVTNEYGERVACRLDNPRVPAADRIDCADPVARKSRPILVGK